MPISVKKVQTIYILFFCSKISHVGDNFSSILVVKSIKICESNKLIHVDYRALQSLRLRWKGLKLRSLYWLHRNVLIFYVSVQSAFSR